MPYKVFKVDGGYKVWKKDGSKMGNGRKYASNKCLTKEKDTKQIQAMMIRDQ